MALVIGIDVGGTNCRIGVVDGLQVIYETRFEAKFSQICHQNNPQAAWQIILQTMLSAISAVIRKYPAVKSIGIGFPGFIAPITGIIAQSPNFPGLKDVSLGADLGKLLGLNVIIENDALAAAYGEYCLIGKPKENLIYLGLGTGVGGGLILNGQPFQGQHGVAMEVGHIITAPNTRLCGCGNKGCMETYASAKGVSLSYFEATNEKRTAAEIAQLADNSDLNAQQAYTTAGVALAQVTAHILKVVDVSHIVIGGGMSGAWHLMQAAFDARLQADLIPVLQGKVQVSVSTAGDQAGILGSALLSI